MKNILISLSNSANEHEIVENILKNNQLLDEDIYLDEIENYEVDQYVNDVKKIIKPSDLEDEDTSGCIVEVPDDYEYKLISSVDGGGNVYQHLVLGKELKYINLTEHTRLTKNPIVKPFEEV